MSNDLVVQLGAKLDQFASDMNQAGDTLKAELLARVVSAVTMAKKQRKLA
jgi:hypothetical protein